MNRTRNTSMKMVATKTKNKVIPCSTPEHKPESPSRDSDSICDSEAASPVPFLCTQDGAEGETDVVWNFYTPNSKHKAQTHIKNTTPLSRKTKKTLRPKLVEKQVPKRKPLRISHKTTELFQELIELNQKLPELLAKKTQTVKEPVNRQSGSEDDIFTDSPEHSPKTAFRNTSRCLRKNVLSSKFSKPEPETALESDDSMNECLIKASQIVEENYTEYRPTSPKRMCYDTHHTNFKKDIRISNEFKMDQDSMDAILNSIKLESPVITNVKKFDSPKLGNDSFDSFVGNLNDSALEQLTQLPIKSNLSSKKNRTGIDTNWTLKELVVHDSPSTKSVFARHNSMPESPSLEINKPSTSGMVFGRYNSMPYDNNEEKTIGDSPIRCTPDEIKRKHQLAREKLLAKRQLPFTISQKPSQKVNEQVKTHQTVKSAKFQPKLPSSSLNKIQDKKHTISCDIQQTSQITETDSNSLKLLIEKKRQEALMKLRRRQPK